MLKDCEYFHNPVHKHCSSYNLKWMRSPPNSYRIEINVLNVYMSPLFCSKAKLNYDRTRGQPNEIFQMFLHPRFDSIYISHVWRYKTSYQALSRESSEAPVFVVRVNYTHLGTWPRAEKRAHITNPYVSFCYILLIL